MCSEQKKQKNNLGCRCCVIQNQTIRCHLSLSVLKILEKMFIVFERAPGFLAWRNTARECERFSAAWTVVAQSTRLPGALAGFAKFTTFFLFFKRADSWNTFLCPGCLRVAVSCFVSGGRNRHSDTVTDLHFITSVSCLCVCNRSSLMQTLHEFYCLYIRSTESAGLMLNASLNC